MIRNFAALIRTILFGWVGSLCRFLKLLPWAHRKPKKDDPHRPPARTPCVPIDHPAVARPDPLLYSQRYLLAQGLAVTWDNPDITLSQGGVPVSSAELQPGTTYALTARVWNNSLDAPVVGMPVHLSYLDFGIGTEPIPIGSGTVDVGVKGSPQQPGFVPISWTTPTTPGHYCLQVLLDPADDTEPANNLGQENTDVVLAQSPATFTFTLRNPTGRACSYRFETDGYQIPERRPCPEERPPAGQILEPHAPTRHPVPAGFTVQIAPATPTLVPGASTTITVTVEPPAGFQGRQPINVNAFEETRFVGGVTLTTVKGP